MKNNATIPITCPLLPDYDSIEGRIREILSNGQITNGRYVRELEDQIADWIGTNHAVAVSSCTIGIVLVLKFLNRTGEVILPSFTFSATAAAVVWAGLKPKFVEIHPETLTIDPLAVREVLSENAAAVLGVHIFGNPAPINELEEISKEYRIPLVFDSAHGFGSTYNKKPLGSFGLAEVFSMSPTKLLTSGEGGFITTNNDKLATYIRWGRNYGDPGNYNCEFSGVNARMPEMSAIIGLESFKLLPQHVARRQHLVSLYNDYLRNVPGIRFQKIRENCTSSNKDFAILIDKEKFGMSRDDLQQVLESHGISTRRYFDPPVHCQKAYKSYVDDHREFPVTNRIAESILSLPLYYDMTDEIVKNITDIIRNSSSV